MRIKVRLLAILASVCMAGMMSAAPVAAAATPDHVGGFRAKVMKVRLDTDGARSWRSIDADTRVWLVDRSGTRSRVDVDELVRGARVVSARQRGESLRGVTLRARSTGNADCSFDSSDDDG